MSAQTDETPLIRLMRAIGAGKRWIFGAALFGAILGMALVWKPTYRGQVYISIGAIKPVGTLEHSQDLLHKLESRAQFAELAGLRSVWDGTRTSTVVQGVAISKDDFDRIDFKGQQGDGRQIGFYVDSPDERVARAISRQVANSILRNHQRLYHRLIEDRRAQIDSYQRLLGRIETVAAASDNKSAWTGVVDLATRIAELEEDQLAPAARSTRIVVGPDVDRINRRFSPPVAGGIGFLVGLFLGIGLVGLVHVSPPEPIRALRAFFERPKSEAIG